MRGRSPNPNQVILFFPRLMEMINPGHKLCLLSDQIPWEDIEYRLRHLYKSSGRPAKPIRLMAGLLLLKEIYQLSDESVVEKWEENPYFQYFTGEVTFRWNQPADRSEMTYFRKRIGEEGVEYILSFAA